MELYDPSNPDHDSQMSPNRPLGTVCRIILSDDLPTGRIGFAEKELTVDSTDKCVEVNLQRIEEAQGDIECMF